MAAGIWRIAPKPALWGITGRQTVRCDEGTVPPSCEVVSNGLAELHDVQHARLNVCDQDADVVELVELFDHRLVEVVGWESTFE